MDGGKGGGVDEGEYTLQEFCIQNQRHRKMRRCVSEK